MRHEKKMQDANTGMASPILEDGTDAPETSVRLLIILVLSLIFMIAAGSAALYRYLQRMNDQPKTRHAWSPRENSVTLTAEQLSTYFPNSIIKSKLERARYAAKSGGPFIEAGGVKATRSIFPKSSRKRT
jgi:hypothetical protein